MTLLFENKTKIDCGISDKDFETIVEDKATMNEIINVSSQAVRSVRSKGYKDALRGLEGTTEKEQLKWDIYLNMSDEEAERIRKYKSCRNTVSAVSFLVILLLIEFFYRFVFKVETSSRAGRTYPETVFFTVAMIAGYGIGILTAKRLYGKDNYAKSQDRNYSYKFYDEYVVVKSDNDGKVLRYKNIKAQEDSLYFYIISNAAAYKLDKNGFSVPADNFRKLMIENGIQITPYSGTY